MDYTTLTDEAKEQLLDEERRAHEGRIAALEAEHFRLSHRILPAPADETRLWQIEVELAQRLAVGDGERAPAAEGTGPGM